MAHFLHHSPCSHCGSSDALAHYSDGSLYCFSCGWTGRPDRPSFKEVDEEVVRLPDDLTHDFPEEVGKWIAPTGLTYVDLIKSSVNYSNSAGGLVRVFDITADRGHNTVLRNGGSAYEVRYVHRFKEGPKTKFFGSKEEVFAVSKPAGAEQDVKLVLVEDSLSAIKVGTVVPSMPLFGSTISKEKLKKTIDIFKCQEVIVWLDADKWKKSQEIASQLQSLGVRSRCVYTDDDPKYVSFEQIGKLTNENF